jgi:hypothetical protein
MSERPNQNTEARSYISWGPKARMDFCNPQMNGDGTNVYTLYGFTDDQDVHLQMFNESGIFHMHNDRAIELVAGSKNAPGDIDLEIVGMNGDINITCLKNGTVRIKAQNIELQADEDINVEAGRNLNLVSKNGRTRLDGNAVDVDGNEGNLVAATIGDFTQRVFDGEGIFVGADLFKFAIKQVPLVGEPVAALL